jgi:hypothetical protein
VRPSCDWSEQLALPSVRNEVRLGSLLPADRFARTFCSARRGIDVIELRSQAKIPTRLHGAYAKP